MKRTVESSAFLAFRRYIESMAPIKDHDWHQLSQAMKMVSIKKGVFLLREDEVCKHIYFIYQGAFRFLYLKEHEEITTALYAEGVCMSDMKSLVTKQPSTIFIQALADSIVIKLSKDELIALYNNSPGLQGIGRILTEYLIAEETEWREMYAIYTVEERYNFLLKKAPHLLQMVPLQYIASYLGMRRETLSRIRNKVRNI